MRLTRHQQTADAHSVAPDAIDATADGLPLAARLKRAYVSHALAGLLPRQRRWRLKRALDLALTLPLLIVAAPLGLASALSVWVRFHQRAMRTQRCAARGGVAFTLRQLQVVARRAPAHADPSPTDAWLCESPLARVTALWRVIDGTMSLVGPAPWTIDALAGQPIGALARLYVAPGVTRLRPFGRLRRLATTQAEADLRYITHGSLWMDIEQLIAATLTPRRRFATFATPTEPLNSAGSGRQEGNAGP
ncbi:MAG TPA: sugar transferase [Ktedonobacterales bacterium]